jgi:hypothetical protein
LRGSQIGFRRTQRVLKILGFNSRDDLAGRDGIAKNRVLRAAATTDSCDTSEGNPEGSLFAFTDALY